MAIPDFYRLHVPSYLDVSYAIVATNFDYVGSVHVAWELPGGKILSVEYSEVGGWDVSLAVHENLKVYQENCSENAMLTKAINYYVETGDRLRDDDNDDEV